MEYAGVGAEGAGEAEMQDATLSAVMDDMTLARHSLRWPLSHTGILLSCD